MELIKSIGQEPEPSPCILVSEQVEHYRAVQGIKRCEWLAVDCSTNYVEQCLLLARRLGIISADPVSLRAGSQASRSAAADAAAEAIHVRSPSIAGNPVPDVMPTSTTNQRPDGLRQQPGGTVKPYALIEVELPSEAKYATVRLEIHEPERIQKTEPEPLNLNQSVVNELVKDFPAT